MCREGGTGHSLWPSRDSLLMLKGVQVGKYFFCLAKEWLGFSLVGNGKMLFTGMEG